MVRGVVATLGMLAVCGVATRWIKVSLHMAFAALAATALALMQAPVGYALLLALPALAWSRLALHRHTPLEVALGTFIGAGAGAAIHYLMTDDGAFTFGPGRSRTKRSFSRPSNEAARFIIRGCRPRDTPDAFRDYLSKQQDPRGAAFFIWLEEPRGLVGVVNLNEIVHGCFRSAYLGYYAFVPHAGRG